MSLLIAIPTFSLPGNPLVAQAVLFLAAAALTAGVSLAAILVGQVIAWGVRRGLQYWRAEP